MRLSCIPVSLFPAVRSGEWTFEDWVRLAAELGLDGVEWSAGFLDPADEHGARTMRDALDRHSMKISMLTAQPDFTHPDVTARAAEVDRLRWIIGCAATLGAPYVRVTAGQAYPQVAVADGVASAVASIEAVIPTAHDTGVKLAFENHSKSAFWEFGDFARLGAVFIEILGRLDDPAVVVNFDTANPTAAGEDPVALYRRVASRVEHVHVNETARPGVYEPTAIGEGAVPQVAVLAELRRAGYDGWLSIEEASGRGRDGVEHAIAVVRDLWQQAAAAV